MNTYGYIYFTFAGYRVAIGRSINIQHRMKSYNRTHEDVQVLGIIPCESKASLLSTELETIKMFQPDNAFRDMFYLSPTMLDWIVKNTIPYTPTIAIESKKLTPEQRERKRERHQERYQDDPEYRELFRKDRREYYHNNPEYRESERKRKQDPTYREGRREYQKKYRDTPEYKERHRENERERRARKRAEHSKNQLTFS